MAGMSCTVLVYGVAKGRGPIPARTSVYHTPHIEIKKRPSGAFSPFPRRGAPKLQSSAERTPQRPSGSSHASGRGGWVPKPYGGVTTPKALFFGAPPRFFGQDQRNGVETAAQGKAQQDKTASSTHPQPPGGDGTQPLQKFGAAHHHPKLSAARRKAAERGRSFRSGRPMTYITTASSAAICTALRARADQKAPVL